MKELGYQMKPQDVVILLKILSLNDTEWTQNSLAINLEISQSEISESIKRSKYAGLINTIDNKVNSRIFLDFIIYGLKVVFPQRPGAIVRGILTAHSAPFFQDKFLSEENYVWPYAKGNSRGQSIIPLYKTIPHVSQYDQALYELLVIVDIIRVGKIREKELAIDILKQKLKYA